MDRLKTTAIGTGVAPVVAQVAVGGRHPGDRMMLNKITVVALLAMALAGCDPTMSPEVMAKEDACRHSTSSWVVWANCVNAVENKYNLAGGDLNQVLASRARRLRREGGPWADVRSRRQS